MIDNTAQLPEEESTSNPLDTIQSCWVEIPGKGFVPSYRFFGLVAEGQPRPFRRFLKGEREGIARYFMCLVCETLFGEAPLVVEQTPDGEISMQDNPEWRDAPFLVQNDDGNYAMSDGSSLYDVTFNVVPKPDAVDDVLETVNLSDPSVMRIEPSSVDTPSE
jgi:hypothetical protein